MPATWPRPPDEVLDGLAALAGTGWSEEEIRLLAAGARAAADLAALPAAARPGDLPELWEPAAATFAAGPGPSLTADGEPAGRRLPRSARWRPPSMPASTGPMTGRPGGPWPTHGRWLASRTGRRTPGCARPRPRPGPGGASRLPGPWPRARPWPASSRRLRCSSLAEELARRAQAGPGRPEQPARAAAAARPGSTSPAGRPRCLPCSPRATATARSPAPCSSASAQLRCMSPESLTNLACATAPRRRRSARGWR